MADALDILKKDWEKTENKFKTFSETDIYKMLQSKSISIVKWIFYISIIELIFWIVFSLYAKSLDHMKDFESISMFIFIREMISYAIIIFFIYLFYKNYKTINATDSVKQLMNSIINTRKTVTMYIRVFIIYNVLASLIVFYYAINNESQWQANYNTAIANGNETAFLIGIFVVLLIFLIVFVILLWLFYRLIYGILLKRLYKNHQELKKIDL